MLKRFLSQTHFLGPGFSLVLLVVVGVVSYLGWEDYVMSANAARRARLTISELTDFLADLQETEALQDGFLLTGDENYLAPYRRALAVVKGRFTDLDKLKTSYPQSANLISQLEVASRQELRDFGTAVDLKRRGDGAGVLEIVRSNRERLAREEVEGLESKVEQSQEASLAVERNRSRDAARLAEFTSALGSSGIFIIVLISAIQVHTLISTRTRLNAELVKSAGDFQHLADSLPQMVWRTTDDGALEYVNRRWTEFSGLTAATTSPAAWQSLLHFQDLQNFAARWNESLSEKTALVAECRLKEASTGRYRWFLFRATPVREEQFGKLLWYATYTDIDQQKATEQALQSSNADLQQFVYSASHDLQEPLRILMLYSQRLVRRNEGQLDPESERDLGFLREAALRMQLLVADLLTYTQIAAPEGESDQPGDGVQAIENSLENLRAAISETEARIEYQQLPRLQVPPIQLQQLFKNLIGNALKYREPSKAPLIEIGAKKVGGEWVISISDNGIGIDPRYHDRIFGIFKRLHTAAEYPGTGLGLAICKKIVERHHGRIWVESQLGRGATFSFSLPGADVA